MTQERLSHQQMVSFKHFCQHTFTTDKQLAQMLGLYTFHCFTMFLRSQVNLRYFSVLVRYSIGLIILSVATLEKYNRKMNPYIQGIGFGK